MKAQGGVSHTSPIKDMTWPLKRGETLSNHDWFPMFHHRLLQSDFVAECILDDRRADLGTALILWAACISEDPAGTLPTNDRHLAVLAKFGSVEGWLAVREGVLHGWATVHVEDDRTGQWYPRLGHPFTLAVVDDMMTRARARHAARTAGADRQKAARIRKKMKGMGLGEKIWGNEIIVARMVRYFNLADIFVTDENLRAALAQEIGLTGDVVPIVNTTSYGNSGG